MHEIDPARTDLVREFEANPAGPHTPELNLLINRLRLMPMAERHILVCTRRGRQWKLAKMPARRGAPVRIYEDQVFDDHAEATRELFRRRWQTATGQDPS